MYRGMSTTFKAICVWSSIGTFMVIDKISFRRKWVFFYLHLIVQSISFRGIFFGIMTVFDYHVILRGGPYRNKCGALDISISLSIFICSQLISTQVRYR